MSDSSTPPPSLDDYPGYFPASKPPFWTRLKVGIAAGMVGLLLGSTGAAGANESNDDSTSYTKADIASAVKKATGDLEQQLDEDSDASQTALQESQAQAQELEQQLTQTKNQLAQTQKKAAEDLRRATAAQRTAVDKAVAAERARQEAPAPAPAPAPDVQQFAGGGGGGGTDPRFSYCYEANDAGFGNYQQGVDPEYDWYRDNDGDGSVCEF